MGAKDIAREVGCGFVDRYDLLEKTELRDRR
jgi:hypothetical protein